MPRYHAQILTPRLDLRPLQPGDEDALFEAKQETAESLSKVFEWASHGFDHDKDRAYVAQCHASYKAGLDLSLVGRLREDGRPVLWTGLHDKPDDRDVYQIGFWVRESAQGQKLAAEAANAMIRYAFNALGARAIVMCHSENNTTSRAIFNRLGFEFEEKRENSLRMAGGRIVDAYWYRMTDPDSLPPLRVSW
jgi:RimJ/RimL family protein N-acetyltransferase